MSSHTAQTKNSTSASAVRLLVVLNLLLVSAFLVISFRLNEQSDAIQRLSMTVRAVTTMETIAHEAQSTSVASPSSQSVQTSSSASAASSSIDATDTSLSPWRGLSFSYPWPIFGVFPTNDTNLTIGDNEGMETVSIDVLSLKDAPIPSAQKTTIKNLVFKPAGVCDAAAGAGGDCSAAFYFTTSRNIYRIRSTFAGSKTTLSELTNPIGKTFYASLAESDL